MKKVVFILPLVALAAIGCKQPVSGDKAKETELDSLPAQAEVAQLLSPETEEVSNTSTPYRYITAYSGLSLREFNNTKSKRLAKMPYGSRVEVVEAEQQPTMTIAGISGSMDKVIFDHRSGYAFSGYLSRYFPPEDEITVEGYANELKKVFPEVVYRNEKGGTASKPMLTESIELPGAQWHEAFFIAQRLFEFPGEFQFPSPKGKELEILQDSKPKRGLWVSQLEVSRTDNGLEKIEYVYSSARFSNRATIEKKGNSLVVSRTEKAK
jgi:hypothetical protein